MYVDEALATLGSTKFMRTSCRAIYKHFWSFGHPRRRSWNYDKFVRSSSLLKSHPT